MKVLLIIPIIFIIVFSIFEFSRHFVYGKFVYKYELKQYKLIFDILHRKDLSMEYISTIPFTFTSKYYIASVGFVPRWSKLHKDIKKLYNELNHANI